MYNPDLLHGEVFWGYYEHVEKLLRGNPDLVFSREELG